MTKLTALKVKQLVNEPGMHNDGRGLYLQVKIAGAGSWVLRSNGRYMGLGRVADVSLAEARQKAEAARRMWRDGIDPIQARDAAKAEQAATKLKGITFAAFAENWLALNQRDATWRASFRNYAYPAIGALAVADIDTAAILRMLEPIWREKCETATRLRGRVETVLDAAKARGLRSGENPARWRGHLATLLPGRGDVAAVEPMAAMPYQDLPGFMTTLKATPGVAARAMQFEILTCCRLGEVVEATRSEIDYERKLWIIPASRMKAGREHRVPLSAAALDLLRALPTEAGSPFLFIGARSGRALGKNRPLELLRRLGRKETLHGFRSTFRDWAAEQTSFGYDVLEMTLAHRPGNAVERAYFRSDLLARRVEVMDAWANFCDGVGGAKVIKLRRRAAS